MIVVMELREAGFTHVASLHHSQPIRVVNGRASRLAGASRPCRQEPAISPVAVQPRNNHLTGVHLMGMHITGVHLMPVYLTGVHFKLLAQTSDSLGYLWKN